MVEYVVKRQASITGSFLWMLIISLLLFWIPVFGPFIGGLVGGKKAGSIGRAMAASLLPALVIALMLIVFSGSFLFPPLAAVLGGAIIIIYVAHATSMVIGALVGGAMA